MTDMWDYGDGLISEGYSIGFYAAYSTSIAAGMAVKPYATGANYVGCTVVSGLGDGYGVALKTPVASNDMIPVLILGVYKMLAGLAAITVGKGVINSYVAGYGYVVNPGNSVILSWMRYGGASYIQGIALQTSAAHGDEILVLITPP